MSETDNETTAREPGVHRLVDMVVEEVSLVDRAANKHRFLVVKRDDSMAKAKPKTEPNKAPKDEAIDETDNAEDAPPAKKPPPKKTPAKKAEGDALSIATAALEALTTAVERLGEAEGDEAATLAGEVAEELAELASELADAAGIDEAEAEKRDEGFDQAIAGVRALLGQVSTMLSAATAKREGEAGAESAQPPPAASPAADRVGEELAAVASTLRTLTDAVKDQALRIAHLEKGIGLPNSRMAPERPAPRQPEEDTGWPLDLNKPLDRESVDKAVSFHTQR